MKLVDTYTCIILYNYIETRELYIMNQVQYCTCTVLNNEADLLCCLSSFAIHYDVCTCLCSALVHVHIHIMWLYYDLTTIIGYGLGDGVCMDRQVWGPRMTC